MENLKELKGYKQMERLKELLKKDGKDAQEFITDALARSFVDFSDGAIDEEYHREFKNIEVFMYIRKRGQ